MCHARPQLRLREPQAPHQAAQARLSEGGSARQAADWALALRPGVLTSLGRVLGLGGGGKSLHAFGALIGFTHLLLQQLTHLGVIQLVWGEKDIKVPLGRTTPSSVTQCRNQTVLNQHDSSKLSILH